MKSGAIFVGFFIVLFLISMLPAMVQALTLEQDNDWYFSGSTRENSSVLTGSHAGYSLTAGQTLNVAWSGQSGDATAMRFYLLNSYQILGWQMGYDIWGNSNEHTYNGYLYRLDSWGTTVIYSITSTDRYYVIFVCRGYYGGMIGPSIHVISYLASVFSTPNATVTPSSATMDRGQSQLLVCTVSGGTPPYTYQWYLDEVIVPGAISNTWTFTSTSSGIFAINVKVTDSDGYSAYSNFALMYVNSPPSVSISPSSVIMDVGQSQLFTSTVYQGTSPYSYQWYLNGAQINGANSSTWVFTPLVEGSYIQIYAKITDSVGVQATSNTATATVNRGLSVFVSPTSVVMAVHQSQLFTSTISGGTSPYSYQWYLSPSIPVNKIINPGFETGNFSGWNQEGPNSASIRPDEHHSGSYSCASPYSGSYLPFKITQKLPSVLSNFVTNVSCWRKWGDLSIDWLRVNYTDGSVSSIGLGSSGDWTYVTLNLAANKTVDALILERTASFANIICIDDVEFSVNVGPVSGATGSTWTFTPNSSGSYTVYLQVTDSTSSVVTSNTVPVTVSEEPFVASILPTSANLDVGQSQLFTSNVTGGTSPYSYRWVLNSAPVSGAINPTWTFTPSSSGSFNVYLNVTDNVGSIAKSNVVLVTVSPPLSVDISPSSAVMDVGQSQLFTSNVTGGTSPYAYRWYLYLSTFGGQFPFPIPGANDSTWTFTPSSLGSYEFFVQVTDSVSSIVNSNNATVTVNPVPSVSISPSSVVMDVNQSQSFTSSVTNGTPPYIYQWYLNYAPVSGATSNGWVFAPTSAGPCTIYVEVNDSVGVQATSNIANVTVNPGTHDVAVTSIAPSKTVIFLGDSTNINVTVANRGNFNETFNVNVFLNVYANTTLLANQIVSSLAPAATTTLNFSWDTTEYLIGPYKITAIAERVLGEIDTDNNALSYGMATVQTGNNCMLIVSNHPGLSTLLPFTINNTRSVAPWSGALDRGTYVITVPSIIADGGTIYSFKSWEDNSTNPTRTITLSNDTRIDADYQASAQSSPVIYTNTIVRSAQPCTDFTINLTVYNVTNLHGWEVKIYYDNRFMNGTNVAEGPFISASGGTLFQIREFNDAYNSTHGRVWLNCTLTGPTNGASGNGTLAIITFHTLASGSSVLSISEPSLSDPAGSPIPNTLLEGVGLIRIRIIADINNDGVVNILDAILLSNSFPSKAGDYIYNPHADINQDGIINILDAIILANHFLETDP